MDKNIIERLKLLLFSIMRIECGVIDFSTGDHEIFVKTKHKCNKKVWTHVSGHHHHPTCGHLNDDMFAINDNFEHGFIVKAHIESNSRVLHWMLI